MRNIAIKLFLIWTSELGDVVYIYFLSRALVALLFRGPEPFMQYSRGHHAEHFCEIILNLVQ